MNDNNKYYKNSMTIEERQKRAMDSIKQLEIEYGLSREFSEELQRLLSITIKGLHNVYELYNNIDKKEGIYMKNNGLFISNELLEKAKFESNNLTAVIEDGVIRIVEEDAELCIGYFQVDEEIEESYPSYEDYKNKIKFASERQLMSKKGTIYLSTNLRRSLEFEAGSILELIIDGENLVIRKLDL